MTQDEEVVLHPGGGSDDHWMPKLTLEHHGTRSEMYVNVGEEAGGMIEGVSPEQFELVARRLRGGPEQELVDAYEERIAHLRTGLEMAADDLNMFRKRILGPDYEPVSSIPNLLGRDVKRSIAIDRIREAAHAA